MVSLPKITGRKLINALQKAGFKISRSKGSHFVLKNEEEKITVVPIHSGETIGPGLLIKILKDCDLTKKDLKELLK